MKKIKLFLPLALLVSLIPFSNEKTFASDVELKPYTVRYLSNLEGEMKTANNMDALTYNTLVKTQSYIKNEPLVEPDDINLVPKAGYKFEGWYYEIECINKCNFDIKVNSNLSLYANYVRDDDYVEEKYNEVELSFKEKVDDNVEEINITGIMNMPIIEGVADSNANAIAKLEKNSTDCIKYVNYVRNSKVTNLKATYANNKVTINYDFNGTSKEVVINLNVKSYYLNASSTYESKAKKYDEYDIKDYSIIMGGSSSMENWSTSVHDMDGLTTTNIGIGGTKVEDWDGLLNERLVYTNSPRGVVYYLGINNIINGSDNGEKVGNALCAMFDHVHEHLPDTTIYFILINYVPGYMSYSAEIAMANDIVKAYSKNKSYMYLIDAGKLLMKPNENPSWAYFRTDGLHMSMAGYILWGGEVKRCVIDNETKLYGK